MLLSKFNQFLFLVNIDILNCCDPQLSEIFCRVPASLDDQGSAVILLVTSSCNRNQHELWLNCPFGSSTDFCYCLIFDVNAWQR